MTLSPLAPPAGRYGPPPSALYGEVRDLLPPPPPPRPAAPPTAGAAKEEVEEERDPAREAYEAELQKLTADMEKRKAEEQRDKGAKDALPSPKASYEGMAGEHGAEPQRGDEGRGLRLEQQPRPPPKFTVKPPPPPPQVHSISHFGTLQFRNSYS